MCHGFGRAATIPAVNRPVKVLVLGDLIPASVHHLLGLLESAMKLLPRKYRVTFKPHPGYAVDIAPYPALAAAETVEPLAQILAQYDVAVAPAPRGS